MLSDMTSEIYIIRLHLTFIFDIYVWQLCLSFILDICTWHFYLIFLSDIYMWHCNLSSTFVPDICIWHLHLTFTFDINIWHLHLTLAFLRKSVVNEIGSTKTVKNVRQAQKQHQKIKNSRKNRRYWAILAAPVVANSGKEHVHFSIAISIVKAF